MIFVQHGVQRAGNGIPADGSGEAWCMLLIIPQTPGEHIFAFLEQLHGPKVCGIRRHGQWLEEKKQGLSVLWLPGFFVFELFGLPSGDGPGQSDRRGE